MEFRRFTVAQCLLWVGMAVGLTTEADPCPEDYLLYGPKTVYETVRWNGTLALQDCEPVHLWMLVRHGTRYTTVANQEQVLNMVKSDVLKNATDGSLCPSAIQALAAWQMRMEAKDDMKLAETGWEELRGIGRRHKAAYPELFANYSASQYAFRHTNYTGRGDRTRDSARAYAEGVFGSYEGVQMDVTSYPDWLLHFYNACEKYKRDVGSQPVAEFDKFMKGAEMSRALRETSMYLGLREGYFDFDLLFEVYEMCRFERGIFGESPWCPLISAETYRILEYAEDVKYYWREAYPHDISYEQACTPVADLLQHLRNSKRGAGIRSALGFTHHPTMDSFYARLGLFKDSEHLTADGYQRQTNRKWRTSLINPMSSNIAFVLKSCSSGFKVEAFVNEEPIVIPGCDKHACPFEQIEKVLRPIADECNVEEICSITSKASGLERLNILYCIALFAYWATMNCCP